MKKWPKNQTQYVPYDKLITPVVAALKHFYKLELNEPMTDFKYKGYDIGERERVCCLPPNQVFTKEHLEYDREDQGREPFENIIHIAYLLGMEQGRRGVLERLTKYRKIDELLFKLEEAKDIFSLVLSQELKPWDAD